MKKLLLTSLTGLALSVPAAWADGPSEPVMDPVVVEADTAAGSEGAAMAIVVVTALLMALAVEQ
ncbi:MAG: hypothetical protein ACLFQL_09410 [Paracoccaceae bacterium]